MIDKPFDSKKEQRILEQKERKQNYLQVNHTLGAKISVAFSE